jgi:DUF1680 family protein
VRVSIDGIPVDTEPGADSYLRLVRDWGQGRMVSVRLSMPVRAIVPHPRVDAVRGCVALARGPIVYCLEQVDQSALVEDIRIDAEDLPAAVPGADGAVVLTGKGYAVPPLAEELYSDLARTIGRTAQAIEVTAVPYFRWANRGPNAMRVWIPVADRGMAL